MIKVVFSLLASALFIGANAQEPVTIEKIIIDTIPNTGKKMDQQKVVTVRIKGDKAKEEKYTIEIDGSKIRVNGKDVADIKDIDVSIGENRIMLNGRNMGIAGFPKQRQMEMESRMKGLKNRNNALQDRMIMMHSNKALLGISMEKVEQGVKINAVTPESGAEKAGLQKGDIITKIEDKDIKAEMDITKIVGENKPGKEISINYLRDGKKKTTKATLGKNDDLAVFGMNGMEGMKGMHGMEGMEGFKFEMPEMPEMREFEMPEMPNMQNFDFKFEMPEIPGYKMYKDGKWQEGGAEGMTYFNNGPKLGLSLKETESGNGLEVTNVEENSVAAKSGLQKGDIVTKAAGTEVNDIKDIRKIVAENKDKSFELNYLRNGKAGKVDIKFPKKLKETSL